MGHFATNMLLYRKRPSIPLLLWGLMSAGLHVFLLLLMPGATPGPGREGLNELSVVAAVRANFVPDTPVPPPVAVLRPIILAQKRLAPPSAHQPPPSKQLAPEARATEQSLAVEPDLFSLSREKSAEKKPFSESLNRAEPALSDAAMASTLPMVATADLPKPAEEPRQQLAVEMPFISVNAIPRYAENPPPVYPEIARRNGWRGQVLLQVSVRIDGLVQHLQVQQTSGFRVLDVAALRAVKNWRFHPARRGGRAVDSEILVPVEFYLSQSI